MTDEQLIAELRILGIDRNSHRVVALLPLVQVAWADGEVQSAERTLIQAKAQEHGMLSGDGARILQNWLLDAPTASYIARGRRCLVALARRTAGDLGDGVSDDTLEDVVALCEQVARSAGGLFGVLWSVDVRERAAIEEIARSLEPGAAASLPWSELTRPFRSPS